MEIELLVFRSRFCTAYSWRVATADDRTLLSKTSRHDTLNCGPRLFRNMSLKITGLGHHFSSLRNIRIDMNALPGPGIVVARVTLHRGIPRYDSRVRKGLS